MRSMFIFYIYSSRINVYLSRINNFRSQEALMLKACLNKQEHFGEEVPFRLHKKTPKSIYKYEKKE